MPYSVCRGRSRLSSTHTLTFNKTLWSNSSVLAASVVFFHQTEVTGQISSSRLSIWHHCSTSSMWQVFYLYLVFYLWCFFLFFFRCYAIWKRKRFSNILPLYLWLWRTSGYHCWTHCLWILELSFFLNTIVRLKALKPLMWLLWMH